MNKKEKVISYLEENKEEMFDFLKDYISIKSTNTGEKGGGEEKEVQEWLAKKLNEFGFEVDKWAADPKGERPNVVATLRGKGDGENLILNGHSDTVEVNEPEKWNYDPWDPVIKDGKLYGRGASDMKGANAAAIWALKALKELGIEVNGDVFLQLVVGEESSEGKTIGTNSAVERGYRAPFAVVMEPTNLEIHISSVGLFCFELLIPGKSVHICSRNQAIFPQPLGVETGHKVGVDALEKAIPFIEHIYKLERQWNLRWRDKILGAGGHPNKDQQGVGVFTVNPGKIEGGTYLASLPGYVKLTYTVWYPNKISQEEIWKELRETFQALASTDDWLKENPPELNVPVFQEWKGFETSEEERGVKVLKESINEVINKEPTVSGFKAVCDATFLNDHDIPSVVFGPGGLSYGVHGDDEYVPIDDLIKAAKVYASLILNWCN